MMTQNKRFIGILLAVVFILLIPLVAMQFTDEVNWDLFDFVAAGVMLLVTGIACETVLRKVRKQDNAVVLIAAILATLFLLWAEVSVGIFGSPIAGS